MNTEITREAVETLAKQEGVSTLGLISKLQAAAASIEDEATLDRLCDIKWEILEA